MKLLTVFFAITFFFVNLVSAQKDFPTVKPGKTYKQSGVKISSPNQTGWRLLKSENLETVFEKIETDEKSNAFAKTSTMIDIYENVEDLLKNLEKMKQAEISKLKRDSLHFNYVNFKETPCLQYDGIFNNDAEETVPVYKYFNLYGYLCPHPQTDTTLIQMEFSNYSNTRGFTEDSLKLIRNFFEGAKFSKVKNK